jgi:parallel beta-helix repeat protein
MSVFTVSTNGELKSALIATSASGGGTILLKNTGATYNLDVFELGSSTGLTTIKSADPDNPAVMDGVRLVKCENIAFENLSFDSRGVSRPSWVKDLMVEKSHNISVSDSTFISRADGTMMERSGDVARGEDMGFVRDTQGFTFENNTVSNYFNGLTLIDSSDLNVSGNEFSKMQGDGIRGGGMQDAVFEGNWLHDWYGSAKDINHDDMFQIWGTNMEQLSKNILIKGNFFDSGEGSATQTILIQNEHWKSDADNYTNIVVTDNVIYNGHTHGISVYQATGVEVTNNTVLYNAQSSTPSGNVTNPPSIRVGNAEGAVVTGNITAKAYIASASQHLTNAIVNFASAADSGFVSDNFVNVYNGGKIDLRDLELLPDSPWFGKFGATATQGGGGETGVTSVMVQTALEGEYGAFVLDASLSHDEHGYLNSDTTTHEWYFSDGTVLKGETVTVDFKTMGLNDIKLVTTRADGSTDSIIRSVKVDNPVIRDIDFNDGALTRGVTFADYGSTNFVAGLEGKGFLLDGDSEVVFNKKIADFYELDQFTIELAFQKVAGDDTGKLFDLHRSMGLSVKNDGSLAFSMKTSDGGFSVDTGSTLVQDKDWHKVSVTYNAAYEELSIWLDGQKLGETHATGTTIPFESWGPMLGQLDFKGSSITAVVDDFLFSKEALSNFEIQQDHISALSLNPAKLDKTYTPDVAVGDKATVSIKSPVIHLELNEADFVTKPAPMEKMEVIFESDVPDEPVFFPEQEIVVDTGSDTITPPQTAPEYLEIFDVSSVWMTNWDLG